MNYFKTLRTLFLIALASWIPLSSQNSVENFASNFTLSYESGEEESLYTYLDEGKKIVLFCFDRRDPQAWTYLQNGVLSTIENDYTEHYKVLYVEFVAQTDPDITYSFGNLEMAYNTLTINIAETTVLNEAYQIQSSPSLYLICPDRLYYRMPLPEIADELLMVGSECFLPVLAHDLTLINTATDNGYCSHYVPQIILQNLGTEIAGEVIVYLDVNNYQRDTVHIAGPIHPFQSHDLIFPYLPDDSLASTLHYTLERLDGHIDEQSVNDTAIHYTERRIAGDSLLLILHTDFWPTETSWEISNGDGLFIAGSDSLLCNVLDTVTIYLENTGCYLFTISDTYGDGLVSGSVLSGTHICTGTDNIASGAISLYGAQGNILFNNPHYGYGTEIEFWGGPDDITSLEADLPGSSLSLWPIPCADFLYLSGEEKEITYFIFDINGHFFEKGRFTSQKKINTQNWPAGFYLLTLQNERGIFTKKVLKAY